MARTQLRRFCSLLGGVGSATKPVRPRGRGRIEVWWGGVAGAMLVIGAFATAVASASPVAPTLEPRSLARAQAIRAQLDARYRVVRGRGLSVTEATATGVIESFTLLTPDLLETRLLPADNGIYYAICPVRASCPYPA